MASLTGVAEPLPADVVHIWLVRPEQCPPMLLEAYEPMLSADEQARRARFVFERDRDRHLVTRALVRTTLSKYRPSVAPDAWTFECNEYGRPAVAGPAEGLALQFNVSHTDGLIACAVALDRELGVDVEYVERPLSVGELAPTVFADAELRGLRRLAEAHQRERFFTLWTLKEAYIKARGMGLSLPLQRFWYEFGAAGPRLTVEASLGDSGESWQLLHTRVTPEHHLALCVRRPPWGEMRAELRWGMPLGPWSVVG